MNNFLKYKMGVIRFLKGLFKISKVKMMFPILRNAQYVANQH